MAIIKVLYPSGGTPIKPLAATPTGWLSDAVPFRKATATLVVAALSLSGTPLFPVPPSPAPLNYFLYSGPDLFAKPYPAAAQPFGDVPPPVSIQAGSLGGADADLKIVRNIVYSVGGTPPFPVVPTAAARSFYEYKTTEVFAKPISASLQQYAAFQPQGAIRSITPQGFYPQPPDQFAKPFPVSAQQYASNPPRGIIPTAATPHGWEGLQLEYRFAKPIPVTEQPFTTAPEPEQFLPGFGWYGYQLDYCFAKPYPASAQPFTTAPAPQQFLPGFGWYGYQLDYLFSRPVPVSVQQYFATPPQGIIPTAATPHGWEGQQLSHQFAKPYPVAAQQYAARTAQGTIKQPFLNWWPAYEFSYRFATPFPVTEQIFSVWDLVGDVPPFRPPGAGKRRDFPSYIPQPAYDAKPNKPFRPIWDKPREGVIEQHPQAVPLVQIPPPPPELFGARETPSPVDVNKLPNFNEFMPPDPMGLAQRMRDAQDMSDAMAVLKAMGLIPDNE